MYLESPVPRLTREQSQALTRERLRQAGAKLLEAEGAAGFGIEQIVREAGFTRGAFYANYTDKLALLLEILKDRETQELRFWNTLFSTATDAEYCLKSVIADAQQLGRPWTRINLELHLEAERNERFRPHFISHLEAVYQVMAELFRVILARHGKAPPPDLATKVIGVRAIGVSLGLSSTFAFREGGSALSLELLHEYIIGIIANSPALGLATESEQPDKILPDVLKSKNRMQERLS